MKTQLLAVASLLMGAASANPVQHAHHSHKQDAVAARDDGGYWYANMDHSGTARGYAPYADDPGQWNVFVAAKANDSQSVLDAINEGERDGMWFASTPRVGRSLHILLFKCCNVLTSFARLSMCLPERMSSKETSKCMSTPLSTAMLRTHLCSSLARNSQNSTKISSKVNKLCPHNFLNSMYGVDNSNRTT